MDAPRSVVIACLFLLAGVARAEVRSAAATVKVADYKVTRTGDVDVVAIPGGVTLGAPDGRPEVPCFLKRLSYPPNYRVQDVVLKAKSGTKTDSGFRLPIAQPEEGPAVPVIPGVFPTADFAWGVRYGESTLVTLSVYAFRYDPKTRRSTFHSDFEFEVRYVESSVRLVEAEVDTPVFAPGQIVRLALKLENAGAPQAVKVRASVYRASTGKSVAEVPARTIARFSKVDSLALDWPTEGRPTGDYTIAAVVNDSAGAELDRKRVSFRLGNPQGEVTDFTADPQPFKVGDHVRFTLGFRNTGNAELVGECVVRIMKSGEVVDELRHKLNALAPGGTTISRDTWRTSRAERSVIYMAVGFVEYSGTASNARSVMLSTNAMPSAVFTLTPDTVKVGQEVRFDASASTDTDGSIAGYRWEFGDGGEAEGGDATHAYHEPGDYVIRLSAEDNEKGIAEATKTVTVSE
jgi:hypothetical protein